MALRMVALTRKKNGEWFARKVIPDDVRAAYKRLHGVSREAHFKAPPGTSSAEAKALFAEWLSKTEGTIEALRGSPSQSLSKRNAAALAGQWYRWYFVQHEDETDPQRWERLSETYLWEILRPLAPEDFDSRKDLEWNWARRPEVREALREVLATETKARDFLVELGISLDQASFCSFMDAVQDNFLPVLTALGQRARGDYSPDQNLETFPVFEEKPINSSRGLSPWGLFDAYVAANGIKPSTINRWRGVFVAMENEFKNVAADAISEDQARVWVDGLVTATRSARVVADVWLASSRRVFSWAVEQKLIRSNPFAAVRVKVRQRQQLRDNKAFTDDEIAIILQAAAQSDGAGAFDRAKRWVPWLAAYSGARSGELTQLRGRDIQERKGIVYMRLTPEAGTMKTDRARSVPLHEHLVAQGFVEMVRQAGDGPLFYVPTLTDSTEDDPLNPKRPRWVKTRERLAGWIRDLGVSDPELSPNHAWRHTFKHRADRAGIPEKLHDAITGHSPKSVARTYGAPTLEDMAEAMAKFPRYQWKAD